MTDGEVALGVGAASRGVRVRGVVGDVRPRRVVKGIWVLGQPRSRNRPYWHWVHGRDGQTYCGHPTPDQVDEVEERWNPLHRCCRKCLERIAREGY